MENINKMSQYELFCESAIELAKLEIISQFLNTAAIDLISSKNKGQEVSSDDRQKFNYKYEEFKIIVDRIIKKAE